jgi:hypothetical protein
MAEAPLPRTRLLTVIAQDPAVRYKAGPRAGQIVTARIRVPAESLQRGPCGYRIHVVDYDSTSDIYYDTGIGDADEYEEPLHPAEIAAYNERLLTEPSFHCQNAYALMMHTLARFEFALGRRLAWGFGAGHQLKVAPHAFSDANAYYSEEDQALLFGYFPSSEGDSTVFTPERLRQSIGGLAEQVGPRIPAISGQPLRNSMLLEPSRAHLDSAEFQEPHRRGEVLVAAMMNAFLRMWSERLHKLGEKRQGMLDRAGTTASKALRRRIAFIGQDAVKNVSAVQNLMDMSTKEKHRYVFFGADAGLVKVLPGVKVHVLGPPTIDQYDQVQKQRSVDHEQFWMLRKKFWQMQASAAGSIVTSKSESALFPGAKTLPPEQQPRNSRWFVRWLRGARAKALLELVLIMDDTLNNTSTILLFEVGRKKLLFPGDAQIENWEYALSDEKILKLLAGVDVYKVGHHGSRNATPKKLWENFKKRGEEGKRGRLTTLISTKAGKHGAAERHTEVPRKSLVTALKEESEYVTTQTLRTKLCNVTTVVF